MNSAHDHVKKKKEKTFKEKCIKSMGLHHWAMVFVLFAYAFLGGGLFYLIERPTELRNNQKSENVTKAAAEKFVAQILNISEGNCLNADKLTLLVEQFQAENDIGPSESQNWIFSSALFFACTLLTTIGFGNFVPQTTMGRLATIAYALIGIPLVLAVLNDLGRVMIRRFKTMYSKLLRFLKKSDLEQEDNQPTAEVNLPLSLAFALSIFFTLICAGIFTSLEDWNFFESFYFFFISFSTIGLGDYTPTNDNVLVFLPLVLIGLSFLSMCINIFASFMEQARNDFTDYLESTLGVDIDTESEDSDPEDEGGFVQKSAPDFSRGASLGVLRYQPSTEEEKHPESP